MTLIHVLIIIAGSIRVIQMRLPVATSLAWQLLESIYSAFTALLTAAERGVKVTVIMPERNDSRLVHFTSRYNYAIALVA